MLSVCFKLFAKGIKCHTQCWFCSTMVQVQVGTPAFEGGGATNHVCKWLLHWEVWPRASMSKLAQCKWMLDLMEELDIDDDNDNDLDYSSTLGGELPDPTLKVEWQLIVHFSVHPKLCQQFKHPTHNVHCILCDYKPFKSIGDMYMHVAKTHIKPSAHQGLAIAIKWLHGGRDPPRQ